MVGDLPFGSTAQLEIEIGGINQGVDYDFLKVTGSGDVSLSGTLDLSLVNTFTPDLDDVFTILTTTGTITGTFDNASSGSIAFSAGGFIIEYLPNSVILHSFDGGLALIPEPRMMAMFLGLFAFAFIRRRR
jgi:hypothetical protein